LRIINGFAGTVTVASFEDFAAAGGGGDWIVLRNPITLGTVLRATLFTIGWLVLRPLPFTNGDDWRPLYMPLPLATGALPFIGLAPAAALLPFESLDGGRLTPFTPLDEFPFNLVIGIIRSVAGLDVGVAAVSNRCGLWRPAAGALCDSRWIGITRSLPSSSGIET
jgi:hypothetical protein